MKKAGVRQNLRNLKKNYSPNDFPSGKQKLLIYAETHGQNSGRTCQGESGTTGRGTTGRETIDRETTGRANQGLLSELTQLN